MIEELDIIKTKQYVGRAPIDQPKTQITDNIYV